MRKSLGRVRGCDERGDGVCFDALNGLAPPSGCSSRPRVGSLVIELAAAGALVPVLGVTYWDHKPLLCAVREDAAAATSSPSP